MQVVACQPIRLVPWRGVQNSRSVTISCFVHLHCHATHILHSYKIMDPSLIFLQSCDLVGCCLQEMLSIALSIQLQVPSSLESRVLVNIQTVASQIKTTSTVVRKYLGLHFLLQETLFQQVDVFEQTLQEIQSSMFVFFYIKNLNIQIPKNNKKTW